MKKLALIAAAAAAALGSTMFSAPVALAGYCGPEFGFHHRSCKPRRYVPPRRYKPKYAYERYKVRPHAYRPGICALPLARVPGYAYVPPPVADPTRPTALPNGRCMAPANSPHAGQYGWLHPDNTCKSRPVSPQPSS